MHSRSGGVISAALRDLLIEHIDGPVAVVVSTQSGTRSVAIRSGLIRPDFMGMRGAWNKGRPRQTFITEKGRRELAASLADWADALCRAQNGGLPVPDKT